MTNVTLQYCVCFGKNDYSDWLDWDIELDGDEETAYQRVVQAGDNPNDCAELRYILDRASEDIMVDAKENFQEYDMLDEDGEIPDGWSVIVEFPMAETDEEYVEVCGGIKMIPLFPEDDNDAFSDDVDNRE